MMWINDDNNCTHKSMDLWIYNVWDIEIDVLMNQWFEDLYGDVDAKWTIDQ